MKVRIVCILFALVAMASCKKEDLAAKSVRETQEKLMGKWLIENTIIENYHPIPTLISSSETTGGPNDYYWFKPDNTVDINSSTGSQTEVFEVINPYQLWIKDKYWSISDLTSTKLKLVYDRNDVVNNSRNVTVINFKR